MSRSRVVVVGLLVAGCASSQQVTIEPTGGATPAGASPSGDDSAFVLSRAPAKAGARAAPDYHLNIGDKWWRFRASFLNVDESAVRDRDANISEVQAPEKFWDQQTAVETVSVWSGLCNECHGGRRRLDDAVSMPAPPADWGRGEGLFFGARKKYADVFYTIYRGGPERNGVRSEMPAWKGKLPKELIWSLMYFLEFQSGGIEGRFPPSLYPKAGGEARQIIP